MLVGILSIPEYVSQIGAPNPLRIGGRYLRQELKTLAGELKEVEKQIAAVHAMLHGLVVLYGPAIVDEELLKSIRPKSRTNKRGLTPACRFVLEQAARPCAVSEICAHINDLRPELLLGHRKPMASVMSVLRSMERRRQVVRGHEHGRSVWRLEDSQSARKEILSAKAPASFQ
jgi:hypothetical protein